MKDHQDRIGQQKWSFPTGVATAAATPAVVNGMVYIAVPLVGIQVNGVLTDVGGSVYALDAASGTEEWSFNTGVENALAVANNTVYFGGQVDGKVYALDAATGQQKWSFSLAKAYDNAFSLAVTNNVVYVGDSENDIYALDATTGQQKWSIPLSEALNIALFIANNVLYVGGSQTIYGLDATTGVKKWSYSMGGVSEASPVTVNGVVYASSADHTLYAFHLATT